MMSDDCRDWGRFYFKDGTICEYLLDSKELLDLFRDNNKIFHREDGPAWECWAFDLWYKDGYQHREDGPAMTYRDGRKLYFIFNKLIEKSTFKRILSYKRKSSLLQYLLSEDEAIRYLAEKRLKELENENSGNR